MKALLDVESLGAGGIRRLLDRARIHAGTLRAGERPSPTLDGRVVGLLFFEPSTRTRMSFDLAARHLGALVSVFDPERSSLAKGESLRDTVLTVSAIGAEILVVRHSEVRTPGLVHAWTGRPVVNAGDGTGHHPTQALADCLTLEGRFGSIEGLRVAVVGDIVHSRVAGSLTAALTLLGAEVVLVGPKEMLPAESDHPKVEDLDEVVAGVDVVYLLRVQKERGAEVGDDYEDRFQLDLTRSARMKPDAVVMHPGPMNRGVEIAIEVADGPRSLILEQVANGVPVRMAALEAVGGVDW